MKVIEYIEEFQSKKFGIDITCPLSNNEKGIILFCHGFKGFKDWGTFSKCAEYFSLAGYYVVKFNYAWNGTTPENPVDFVDLEAFGNNNFLKELKQTHWMIDWIISTNCSIENKKLPINIIGHSRGGGIATLTTAQDSRISKLITWAAVSDFGKKWDDEFITRARKLGVIYVPNGRTKQNMPLYSQLYENYFKHFAELNIPQNLIKISQPTLIIHGTKDEAVPLEDAVILHKGIAHSQLFVIENANHVFGSSHPFTKENLPKDLEMVLQKTVEFLSSNNG